MTMKVGDTLTFSGIAFYRQSRRKWWQFWKPRWVAVDLGSSTFSIIDGR